MLVWVLAGVLFCFLLNTSPISNMKRIVDIGVFSVGTVSNLFCQIITIENIFKCVLEYFDQATWRKYQNDPDFWFFIQMWNCWNKSYSISYWKMSYNLIIDMTRSGIDWYFSAASFSSESSSTSEKNPKFLRFEYNALNQRGFSFILSLYLFLRPYICPSY